MMRTEAAVAYWRSYSDICLEGLGTIMGNVSQFVGWYLNPKPTQRGI